MSTTISIEIPREVIHATRMTPRELRRELAVYLFQQRRLSLINLARIGKLGLLQELYGELIIPEAVWREVVIEGTGQRVRCVLESMDRIYEGGVITHGHEA